MPKEEIHRRSFRVLVEATQPFERGGKFLFARSPALRSDIYGLSESL